MNCSWAEHHHTHFIFPFTVCWRVTQAIPQVTRYQPTCPGNVAPVCKDLMLWQREISGKVSEETTHPANMLLWSLCDLFTTELNHADGEWDKTSRLLWATAGSCHLQRPLWALPLLSSQTLLDSGVRRSLPSLVKQDGSDAPSQNISIAF